MNTSPAPDRIYDPARAFGDFAIRRLTPGLMALPHWHGHVEINILSGAAMTYDFDGARVTIPDGAAALFWAGVPHRVTNLAATPGLQPSLINIYLPLDRFLLMPQVTELQRDVLGGAVLLLPSLSPDSAAIAQWEDDLASGDPQRIGLVETEINAVLRRAALGRPTRILDAGKSTLTETGRAHVVSMIRHIVENLDRPLSNAAIARVTGLHANYALNLFSSVLNMPMKQFVIRLRLTRARSLLQETSLPVNAIAAQSGFGSLSQFYDAFQKAYGMTPRGVRHAQSHLAASPQTV